MVGIPLVFFSTYSMINLLGIVFWALAAIAFVTAVDMPRQGELRLQKIHDEAAKTTKPRPKPAPVNPIIHLKVDASPIWDRFDELEHKIDRIKRNKRPTRTDTKGIPGYIYLLQKEGSSLYKIGKSTNPDVRLHRFEVILPFPITPLHVIPAVDYSAAETLLHKRYAKYRKSGEWFDLPPECVLEIKAIQKL